MSRSNIIKENNKKLFEARLQMKPKLGVKRNQISFEYKRYNDNNLSLLNNSQPFTKIIFQKQLKNHSTLDNSFLNNINNINNSILNKKIIKINKINQQKNKKININVSHNKSNLLIKDITFFHLKNSPKNNKIQNKTLINVNKRISKQNSSNKAINKYPKNKSNQLGANNLNIKKSKKINRNLNVINTITRSITTINETNNNITINNSNYIMNNTNININNINNGGNNRVIFKEKLIPKFKLTNDMYITIPNRPYNSNLNSNRNDSSSNKKFNKNNSYLMNKIEKIQKIKYGKNKKIGLNNTNFNKKLNDVIFGTNVNQKGRNSINLLKSNNINNNKKTVDISKGQTQRNLFLGKNLGKLFQKNSINNNSIKNSNNNSRKKKQNNTLNFDNYHYDYDIGHNRKINKKNSNILNRILIREKEKEKDKDKKISRNTKNNINSKRTAYNKLLLNGGIQIFNNNSNNNVVKTNNIYSDDLYELNDIINNNYIHKKTEFKDIDKTEQIIEENLNGNSTKINDDFFSTEKKQINDSSIDEDSGILSMNEVQDIIHYNDMNDVKKENNFLFNYNEYNNFIEKYKKNIINKFFDNDNYDSNQNKIKSKKKYILYKDNIKDNQYKNSIGIKIHSHNNSSKKK